MNKLLFNLFLICYVLNGQQIDWQQQIKNKPGIYTVKGIKCDGITDDGPALQAQINAVPEGSTINIVSPSTSGCLISTGINISTPYGITISGGGPAYTKPQLLAGTTNMTMFTLSSASRVKFSGLQLDANGKTGVTAISEANSTNTTFDFIIWNGNFTNAIYLNNTYFTHINDSHCNGETSGNCFYGTNSANSLYLTNTSTYMGNGATGYALWFQNSNGLAVSGGTFECNSTFVLFNYYGADIGGNYFENQTGSCGAQDHFISFGSSYAGTTSFGTSVHGNIFNSGVSYDVVTGTCQGLKLDGNYMNYLTKAILYTIDGSTTINHDCPIIGANSYSLNGGGFNESTIFGYDTTVPNSLQSNMTELKINPTLYSGYMVQPQTAWVSSNSATWHWNPVNIGNGPINLPGYFGSIYNNSNSITTTARIFDPEFGTSGPTDSVLIHGNAVITPWDSTIASPGGTATSPTGEVIFRNNHDVYIGEDGSTGSGICGSTAYSLYICTNDTKDIILGTGNSIRGGFYGTQTGFYIKPITYSGLGTCNSTYEGESVPITNSNTNTPGATISGTGSYHGYAHCNGTNWVFSF